MLAAASGVAATDANFDMPWVRWLIDSARSGDRPSIEAGGVLVLVTTTDTLRLASASGTGNSQECGDRLRRTTESAGR